MSLQCARFRLGRSPRMNRRRFFAAMSVGLAIVLAACASPAAPSWTYAPPAASASANAMPAGMAMPGMSAPAVAAGGPSVAAGGVIAIDAFDLGFKPVAVAAAETYPVTFHNTGSALHDLTFADGTKLSADPGATVKGTVKVPAAG